MSENNPKNASQLLTLQIFYKMNIISDSSLDYLDEMTNGGLNESESDAVLYVQPTIRDVGDIGVTNGVRF